MKTFIEYIEDYILTEGQMCFCTTQRNLEGVVIDPLLRDFLRVHWHHSWGQLNFSEPEPITHIIGIPVTFESCSGLAKAVWPK